MATSNGERFRWPAAYVAAAATLLLDAAGAFLLENMDPSKFTCLVPIEGQQSLADSELWQQLLATGHRRWKENVRHMLESSTKAGKAAGIPGAQAAHAQQGPQRSKKIEMLLQMVDREIADQCIHQHDFGDAIGKFAKRAHSRSLSATNATLLSRQPSHEPSRRLSGGADKLPLLHEGEACWEECNQQAGTCNTGFCGRGLCCRRFELNTDCLLHAGCKDHHCCVEEPAEATSAASVCYAKPGKFCLSTLVNEKEDMLSSVQRCAMQQMLLDCPPGFYCPGGPSAPVACGRGWFCPMGSVQERPCEPGFFCPVSYYRRPCPPGTWCPEYQVFPRLCPERYYCPNGQSINCPEGFYCGPGSYRPVKCGSIASCPESSVFPKWPLIPHLGAGIVILVYVLTMTSVPGWLYPPGSSRSFWGCFPPIAVTLSLLVAWGTRLELMPILAKGLGASAATVEGLSMQNLVEGTPRSQALGFLTLLYCCLLYGLFVSMRIRNKTAQQVLDSMVTTAAIGTLSLCFGDRASLMFMLSLWLSFKLVCALLMKQGPMEFRVAFLSAGLLAVAGGLVFLGMKELAVLLAVALLTVVGKEGVHFVIPHLQNLMRRRKIVVAESELNDTPFRPLISALSVEALDARSSVKDLVTAACITAGARASLAESKKAGVRSVDVIDLSKAIDSEAWAPWRDQDLQQGGGGGSSSSSSGGARNLPGGKGVAFELQDVSYQVDGKRKLLKGLSFNVPPGATVAIMGASGSGKTTLCSVLSGRCGDGRVLGRLALNGVPKLPSQMAELRPLIGYVPQDDVMHTGLTVTENMSFQAQLRLVQRPPGDDELPGPGPAPKGHRTPHAEHVARVVQGLGLAQAKDRVVGDGLSGGQRKRVSIGMEVVSSPRMLLLDEPSTGLDSSTAHRIMEMVLQNMKGEECTTFATIHQPRWNSLSLFDMLIVLAPGGYLCYAGPVAAAKAYFESMLHVEFQEDENPADTIIDVCTFESARRMAIEATWRSPPQCLRAVLFPTPESEPSTEEDTPWQPEEFGRMLAATWADFSALRLNALQEANGGGASSSAPHGTDPGEIELSTWHGAAANPLVPAVSSGARAGVDAEESLAGNPERVGAIGCLLQAEALERTEMTHWGQQVWTHMSRALLIQSREIRNMGFNVGLLLLAVRAVAVLMPHGKVNHVFMRNGLLLLLLGLAQGVAAQRVFGGEECLVACREASVSALSQVLYTFMGKDLTALVEIALSSLLFTMVWWPVADSYASVFDIFETGFSFLYAIWGINYVLSILLLPSVAVSTSVVLSFMSFLFCGLRPQAHVVFAALGGYGRLFLLVSPVRWALAHWTFNHIVGADGMLLQGMVKRMLEPLFEERSFSIHDIPLPAMETIEERWGRKSSWVVHTGQLYLLGFLFRFVAVICLLGTSSATASGGQLSLGASSIAKSRMLKDSMFIFLAFFIVFCIGLLGRTF